MAGKTNSDLIRELQTDLTLALERLRAMKQEVESLRDLRERLAVAESQLAESKRAGQEADHYSRTLLGIGLGALLSLVGGIVVQLVIRSLPSK